MIYLLKQRKVKWLVDIILMVGLILTRLPLHHTPLWVSPHCLIAIFLSLFTFVHLYQHWGLTKKLFTKSVVVKHKWSAFTLYLLILVCLTVLFLPFSSTIGNVHHILSEVYCVVVLLHVVQKWKLFLRLFK